MIQDILAKLGVVPPSPQPNAPAPGPAFKPAPTSNLPVFPAIPLVQGKNPYDANPKVNLGVQPLIAPLAPVHLGGPDWSKLSASLTDAFPQFKERDLPDYVPRAAPKAADLTPYLAKMTEALQPVDRRLSERDAWNEKLQTGWQGAAAGAMNGETFGDAFLGATSGFFGAQGDYEKQRREENAAFEEAVRASQAQIAGLEMQVEQDRVAHENATTENDFFNTQNALAASRAQLDEARNTAMLNAEMTMNRINSQIDMDTARGNMAFTNANIDRDHRMDVLKYETQKALRESGARTPVGQSEDGQFMTVQYTDPQTGETFQETVPTTPGAQINQTMQNLVATGVSPEEAQRTVHLQSLAQYHPEQLKQELIMDFLRTGNEVKLFDPGDAGENKYIFPLNSADYLGDLFSESPYEKAVNAATAAVEAQVRNGALAPEQMQEALLREKAARLAPLLTPDMIAKAQSLSAAKPGLVKGLDFLK